jgi:hypothetical protein
MPTRFEQQFKRVAVPNLVRQFGECIQYFPGGAGSGRDIDALVVRDPLAVASEVGELLVNALIIRVENNECRGITAEEIDTGRDKVFVALKNGGAGSLRSIVQLLSDANGFLRFLVQ